MTMKIKYISEDNLLSIRTNLSTIGRECFELKNLSIEDVIIAKDILLDTAIEIPDFDLYIDPNVKANYTDSKNIEILYGNMKSLSDSQASDERLWVAYTMFVFKDYMEYRWGHDYNSLKIHYIYGYSKQQSLFRNGISRLWWLGRITYDETNTIDPFSLTKFMCRDEDFIESISGRNVFNNRNLCLGMLSALKDFYDDGHVVNRKMTRAITKYAVLISSTYVLDMLTREEIYDKFKKEIIRLEEEFAKNEM